MMISRTPSYLLAPAFVAWMALSGLPAHAKVADQRTPTLDSKRTTDPNAPAPEPATDVVAGQSQPPDPLTNLTPGAPANPETPTPGSNIDAQAAAGLADARLAASQNAPILDLTAALTIALRDNPQRKASYAAVQAAQARTGTAKSAGRFQAGVTGNAGRTQNFGPRGSNNNFGGGTNGGNTGGTTGGNQGGGNTQSRTRDVLSVNVTGQLPIYTGGRVKASTRVALANLQAQQAQRAQVEQDLILNTTSAYLTVLRTQQLLDVTESNLAVSRERLRVARVRYDAGASARLDVLRAETDLANARQLRIQAANNLGQSASNFNTLLGRAPSTPFRVVNITSLQLPADLPLYVSPAASSGATAGLTGSGSVTTQGGTTTPATNAGTPGITAPTQTNPGVPGIGGGMDAGQTNGVPGSTSGLPGSTGIGVTQPGSIGQPGTDIGAGQVPSPAPDVTTQGGTTTAPGTTAPTTGTTAPGATKSLGSAAVTPGVSTTPGVTTQTPGAISGGTGTGSGGTGTTGGFGAGSFGGGLIAGSTTTGGITAPAGGVSDGAAGSFGGTISSSAGAQLAVSAGTSRQSLAVTQAQIRAAEASVELAQAQRRPSISLNPGLLFSNPASFLGRFAASIGLGVSQTLFSGGRIASQVAEAKATLEQTRQNYSGQVLQVQNSIEGSLLTLDSAQRRLASADIAVGSAREAVRAAQLGFEAGARTALDVSDAQAALLSSQTESVNARYDVAGAQANLAASVGVLSTPAQTALNSDEARLSAQAATEAARQDNSQGNGKRKKRKFLGIF